MSESLSYVPETYRWQAGDASVFFPKHQVNEKHFTEFVRNRFFPYFRIKSFTGIFIFLQCFTFLAQLILDGLDIQRLEVQLAPANLEGPFARTLMLSRPAIPDKIRWLNIFGRILLSADGYALFITVTLFASVISILEATIVHRFFAPCICLLAACLGSGAEVLLTPGIGNSVSAMPAFYSLVGYGFGYLCLNYHALQGSKSQDTYLVMRLVGLLAAALLLPLLLIGARGGAIVVGTAAFAGLCVGLVCGLTYENLLVEDDRYRRCCRAGGVLLLLASTGLVLALNRLEIVF